MNISKFDLNLLRVFDTMMTERNVTRAARRVFLSQPAMSHALARLREEIGDSLFVSAGREMRPTARATALAPAVHQVLEQFGALLGESRFDPSTANTALRIGTIDLGEYLLAPMFAHLMKEAPHIRFSIRGLDESNFQQQLATGELDLALGVMRGPFAAGIHSRRLAADTMVGLVRKGHPLTRKSAKARDFKQVRRLAIATRAGRFEELDSQAVLEKAGISGEVAYETPHLLTAPTLLMNSDLMLITIGTAARLLCAQHPLATVALPVRLPPIEPQMIWHELRHHDQAQEWIRAKIVAVANELYKR